MGFDKIEAVSLTDQFVHKVESMIISGELMPGDQLPPARELSARMGVSRPVISAGLIELEKMGFVEIVTRQGVYVSDYRKTGSLDTLTALLNYNGGVPKADLSNENLDALAKGFVNLEKHIENIQKYGVPVVVTLNSFVTDTEAENEFIRSFCEERDCEFALAKVWEKGGEGGIDLYKYT